MKSLVQLAFNLPISPWPFQKSQTQGIVQECILGIVQVPNPTAVHVFGFDILQTSQVLKFFCGFIFLLYQILYFPQPMMI